MIAFVTVVFAFNLILLLAVPDFRHSFQKLPNDPSAPAFVRWSSSPIAIILGLGCTIGLWVLYLGPFRRRFDEQGQIYIFGLALATAGGLILRTLIWFLPK